ncbi:hypothetical protein FOCC_FOCC000560, partial [Frankliniella occidentalis]
MARIITSLLLLALVAVAIQAAPRQTPEKEGGLSPDVIRHIAKSEIPTSKGRYQLDVVRRPKRAVLPPQPKPQPPRNTRAVPPPPP